MRRGRGERGAASCAKVSETASSGVRRATWSGRSAAVVISASHIVAALSAGGGAGAVSLRVTPAILAGVRRAVNFGALAALRSAYSITEGKEAPAAPGRAARGARGRSITSSTLTTSG